MTKNTQLIIRQIYQNIATQEERDLYLNVLDKSREEKIAFITANLPELTDVQKESILSIVSLTKEERAVLTGQAIRGVLMTLIVKIVNKISSLFGE